MSDFSLKTSNEISAANLRKAVISQKVTPSSDENLNELASETAAHYTSQPVSRMVLSGLVGLLELAALVLTGYVSGLLMGLPTTASMLTVKIFFSAILTVGFVQGASGYSITSLREISQSLTRMVLGLMLTSAVIALTMGYTSLSQSDEISWLAIWFQTSVLALVIIRFAVSQYILHLTKSGRLDRRVVIVGGGEKAAELIYSLQATPNSDLKIVGIFDDRKDERSPSVVAGYPRLGTVAELMTFARKAPIDMMIVTLPLVAEKRLLKMLRQLWVLPVDIRLWLHNNDISFKQRAFSLNTQVPMLDVFNKPIANWNSVIKRVFDVVVASLAIVLLSPIMILTAIAVKLDSKGPIIFKQMRDGFNNQQIRIFKFRSLYTEKSDFECKTAVTKGDSRVTRVGRFIRKTSIDELPQLFNVLTGELSLVGPRPHVPNAHTNDKPWAETVNEYIARHKVKPGITGWAQITGWRGEVDSEEKLKGRVEADLHYIENWSIWFDIYILLITPMRLLNTENAY